MDLKRLKFRAWDKQKKQMSGSFGFEDLVAYDGEVRSVYFKQSNNNVDIEVSQDLGYGLDSIMSNKECLDRYIFMQYTGLKDKNGVEIYEGDIVKVEPMRMEVVKMYNKGAYFSLHPFQDDGYHWSALHSEVVSNIYENKYFLK